MEKIERKVDEIHEVLVGNDEYKKSGLIQQVQQNTKFRRRSGWLAGAIAAISTGIAKLWGG